jgi:hypothetical protein
MVAGFLKRHSEYSGIPARKTVSVPLNVRCKDENTSKNRIQLPE